MIPSIRAFSSALQQPQHHFATLGRLRAACGPDALPTLCRRTRFVEAAIEWEGARYLLCAPLCSGAIARLELVASRLGHLHCNHLTEYRILRREMICEDPAGGGRACDLILHALPEGLTLDRALESGCDPQAIDAQLHELEAEFLRMGFSHNNLKPENLLLTPQGRLVALRYHDARFAPGLDAEAFAALHRMAARYHTLTLHDAPPAPYRTPVETLREGYLSMGPVAEQLIRIETHEGFGFIDTSGRTVIAPHFRWADDFREGRAEVETRQGMGLIDKRGEYVIPPRYEIVDYDDREGISRVRRDGKWALLDYSGHALTDFMPLDELPLGGSEFCKPEILK